MTIAPPEGTRETGSTHSPGPTRGAAASAVLERHYREQIPGLKQSLAAASKKARDSLIAVIVLALLGVLTMFGAIALRGTSGWWILPLSLLIWGVTVFCGLFVLVGTAMYFGERRQRDEIVQEIASAERMAGIVAPDDESDYFDQLVAINLTNLSDYYSQVRAHAGRSFTLAAAASAMGFLLVVGALVFGFVVLDERSIAYIGVASGTAIEFISAVFFWLYSKTVRQLKEYHDSLLQVQNVLLSLRMVESVVDATERNTLASQVIRSLIEGCKTPS